MKAAIKIIKLFIFVWLVLRMELSLAGLRKELYLTKEAVLILHQFSGKRNITRGFQL